MDKPISVSVIIPTYNCSRWLPVALESIFADGVEGIEVIVIDDGSTDKTDEELKRKGLLSRVRYVYQKQSGPAAARNRGCFSALGEYIALLDADDIWLPGKLSKQLSLVNQYAIPPLCLTDLEIVSEDCSFIHPHRNLIPPDPLECIRHFYLGKIQRVTPTALFSRRAFNAVGGFSEDLPRREDHFLFMQLIQHCGVAHLPELLVKNRVRKGSMRQTGKTDLVELNRPFINKGPLVFPHLAKTKKTVLADLTYAQAAINKEKGNYFISVFGAARSLTIEYPYPKRLFRFLYILIPGAQHLKRFLKIFLRKTL
jgi:glycosyltransferase involved in cell wall biosynthesis